MTPPHVSSEDAIRIYALSISYLHDAQIDNDGYAHALHVKEMALDIFYIWSRDQHDKQGSRSAPLAICRYNRVAQTWKAELISGETLTLLDKGSVWEVVKDEPRLLNGKVAKKVLAGRVRRHLQT
jgi:hypothetical protein